MCTLSYLPKKDTGYFLTSNRDEHINRSSAMAPAVYLHGKINLLYARDVKAGGTWLAAADNGFSVCLLNGAFEKHFPEPPYRRSRGLVLLDFFGFNDVNLFGQLYNFEGIEPFTLVIFTGQRNITELRWDGTKLNHKTIDGNVPHIWSSSTLYNLDIRKNREDKFHSFTENSTEIGLADLLKFHHFSDENVEGSPILLEPNPKGIQTISVSCLESSYSEFCLHHNDLLTQTTIKTHLFKNLASHSE